MERESSEKEKSKTQFQTVHSTMRAYRQPKLVRGPRLSAITAEDAAISGIGGDTH